MLDTVTFIHRGVSRVPAMPSEPSSCVQQTLGHQSTAASHDGLKLLKKQNLKTVLPSIKFGIAVFTYSSLQQKRCQKEVCMNKWTNTIKGSIEVIVARPEVL